MKIDLKKKPPVKAGATVKGKSAPKGPKPQWAGIADQMLSGKC